MSKFTAAAADLVKRNVASVWRRQRDERFVFLILNINSSMHAIRKMHVAMINSANASHVFHKFVLYLSTFIKGGKVQ